MSPVSSTNSAAVPSDTSLSPSSSSDAFLFGGSILLSIEVLTFRHVYVDEEDTDDVHRMLQDAEPTVQLRTG